MKHTLVKSALGVLLVIMVLQLGVLPVAAQSTTILPPELADFLGRFPGGAGIVDFITDNVRLLITVLWLILVVAAIGYSIVAGIKYISAQGDAGKIEDAQKAIKGIWIGVGSVFVSIVVMVLILAIAGVSPDPGTIYETCLLGAGSEGCQVCNEEGIQEDNLCELCEEEYDIQQIREEYQVDQRCK